MKDSEILDWLEKNSFGAVAFGDSQSGRQGWHVAGFEIKEPDLRRAIVQARRLVQDRNRATLCEAADRARDHGAAPP